MRGAEGAGTGPAEHDGAGQGGQQRHRPPSSDEPSIHTLVIQWLPSLVNLLCMP